MAAIVHGVPRTTLDIDLLIAANEANASALLVALLDAGLGTAMLTDAADILAHEVTIFATVFVLMFKRGRLASTLSKFGRAR